MVLLDTDVMIDILRGHPPALQWLSSLGDEEIALPGFVVMELLQGCRSKAEERRTRAYLLPYTVIWPSTECCNRALAAFASAHLAHGLGILDALVGQLAVELNLPLHTYNRKHYAGIAGLRTEQPYGK